MNTQLAPTIQTLVKNAPGTDTAASTLRVFATVGQQVEHIEGDDLVWDTFQVDLLIPRHVEDVDTFVNNTIVDDFPGYALVEWWIPDEDAANEF